MIDDDEDHDDVGDRRQHTILNTTSDSDDSFVPKAVNTFAALVILQLMIMTMLMLMLLMIMTYYLSGCYC